jgi:hypothetical protein
LYDFIRFDMVLHCPSERSAAANTLYFIQLPCAGRTFRCFGSVADQISLLALRFVRPPQPQDD